MSEFWSRYVRMADKALDSLRWYWHTRPDALRHTFVPGFVTLVTLLIGLVWGQPQLIVLAVLFAAAFLLLVGELTGELRDLETDVQAETAAKREIAPVLAQLAVEHPPEADSEPEPVSDPQPIQPLSPLPVDEAEPNTLSLVSGPLHTPGPPAPTAMEQVTSHESENDPIHEVREPWPGPVLHSCRSFLDACDFAFDYLDENDPDELEIFLVNGESRMKVWSYSRSNARATEEIEDKSTTSG
jgi:hypothetical protein